MKVDRTKLKKTPTEAVSIQKFALFFFHFSKNPYNLFIKYVTTCMYRVQ